MDLKIIFLYMALAFVPTVSAGGCSMDTVLSCRIYNVTCDTFTGRVALPSCTNYNITLTIKNLANDTLSSKYFATTNFDSKVRAIEAYNNSWNRLHTDSFKFFVNTLQMDLSNNFIRNIEDKVFAGLIFLEHLNLSRNLIVKLNSKSFYTSSVKPLNILTLDLSKNLLEYLPNEPLQHLSNLTELYLNNNKLKYLDNNCFYGLNNLIYLTVRQNYLQFLNVSLNPLKSLKELDVSFNLLKKISGYEMIQLISLESVNMSYNIIESIDSNCFNQALNLKSVDFRCNEINSTFESYIFINNYNLTYLNFYNNSIMHLEDNIFKHSTLKYLNFEENNLSGVIVKNSFAGLQNVVELNLSKQNITELANFAFSDIGNLQILNLSSNAISTVHNTSFDTTSQLSVLDISHNNLTDISFLQNCLLNLTELYLKRNNLTFLSRQILQNHTQIKTLDISMNNIYSVEEYSLPLKNLQYLQINGNSLVGNIKENIFSPAKYLRYLDLNYCNLNEITENAFNYMPLLARLNISHNGIKLIGSNNLVGLSNIYSLDISYNQLSYLDVNMSALINLKSLYINNNNFSNIPKTVLNVSTIMFLDISNNKISDLSLTYFEGLLNLQVLDLSNNRIKVFNNMHTNSLSKLVTLKLSSNTLENVNVSYFKDLISLDISRNNITSINKIFFQNIDHLQSLDLSINKIADILPGTFQNAKLLKLINLSSNLITKLRYGSFLGLHKLEVLDLSKNNISDIEVHVFHECIELRRLIIDYNHISVIDIEKLLIINSKLSSISLGGNPISCKEIVRTIKNNNQSFDRHVEITSIDKIYHEDNVHGIKCGINDVSNSGKNQTDTSDIFTKSKTEAHTITTVVIVWCSLLSIVIIILGIGVFGYYIIYFRMKGKSESIGPLRMNSIEMNGSEFQSDLLS